MTDHPDFNAMSKDELAEFAEVRGIEFDKRWGAAKLIAAIEEALTDPAKDVPREAIVEAADAVIAEAVEAPEPVAAPEPAPKPEKPASAKPKPGTLSREDIYDACVAWANGFCRDIEHLDIEQDAEMLSIRIVTKHGEGHGAVEGFEPTDAGLTEALALIRKQIG